MAVALQPLYHSTRILRAIGAAGWNWELVSHMLAIEQIIEAVLPETIAGYLGAPPYALKSLQQNVYCLRSATERLFLKRISAKDRYGQRVSLSLSFPPSPRLTLPAADAPCCILSRVLVNTFIAKRAR